MSSSSIDALIVGAGPVGLTMAAVLAHHGRTYRVIDKAAAPSDKSKALVIWSRTMELFSPLGITNVLVEAGTKLKGGTVYANGERLMHINLTGDDSPFGFPLMIPQNETERVLAAHLAGRGVLIERGMELDSFTEQVDSVNCRLRNTTGQEEVVQARWLIGCDGAHSTVRHLAQIPFTGRTEPSDWMLADVKLEGTLPRDEVSVFWHKTGLLLFFPFGTDRFRVIATGADASRTVGTPDIQLSDVQEKVDIRGPGGLRLKDDIWVTNFHISERKVREYRRGRIVLAGDAAHIHSPAGGQGMNTGMQDAFNLGWKLALVQDGRGKSEPLLESYSAERSEIGDQVLKAAGMFTTVATLRSPIMQSVRNHVAPLVTSFQSVREHVRREWSEISLKYTTGPLAQRSLPGVVAGFQAGERLPDGQLVSATGDQVTTLFATFDGRRHSLLLLPGEDHDSRAALLQIAAEVCALFPDLLVAHLILKDGELNSGANMLDIPVWFDKDRVLHSKLHGAEPTSILIRPDGYIGHASQSASSENLKRYLSSYLNPI